MSRCLEQAATRGSRGRQLSPSFGPLPEQHSVSLRRQERCPTSGEEEVRLVDDLQHCFSFASNSRTTSPAKLNVRKVGLESLSTVCTSSNLRLGFNGTAGNSVRACLPPTGSSSLGAFLQAPSPTALEDPITWRHEFALLQARFHRSSDAVTIYHDYAACLNSRATMRHVCIARPLPDLERVQEALRHRLCAHAPVTLYDVCEQQCSTDGRGAAEWGDDTVSVAAASDVASGGRGPYWKRRNDVIFSQSTLWYVACSSYENEVVVCNTLTGQRLLRILDPKMRVAVTALQHAPFRGFIESQQLHVLPVREPRDVLRLKPSQLALTDYVWLGFQDGTVRIVPANHHHVRACGASSSVFKAPSANLVYELPRYQGGAIVSIVCSPCHEAVCESGSSTTWGLSNRVSDAVRCMTAASSEDSDSSTAAPGVDNKPQDTSTSQHLSLVCTAARDASIVVWDVRKVYEAVAAAQRRWCEEKEGAQDPSATGLPCVVNSAALPSTTGMSNDIITFDCTSPVPGLQNMQVRSTCSPLVVKPLMKLSGGFAGLTTLRWVSSLIVASGCDAPVDRNARIATRDCLTVPIVAQEVPRIELTQAQTRFEKREEQRRELELTEEEMQGVELELEHMMPPLAAEPVQSLRVHLLVAADCMGTLHFWNLNEELRRHSETEKPPLGWPASFGAVYKSSLRCASSSSVGHVGVSKGSEGSQRSQATTGTSPESTPALKARARARKLERDAKSRRTCRGLGLAEARENRTRLSEMSSNTVGSELRYDNEAAKRQTSLQRTSIGRSSIDERDLSHAAHARRQKVTSGRESGRASGNHTTVPSLSLPRKSLTGSSATVHTHALFHNPSLPQRLPLARNAIASTVTVQTKTLSKSRHSPQATATSMSRSPFPSTSPSRGSAVRPSTSPSRAPGLDHHAPPLNRKECRQSLQRGSTLARKGAYCTATAASDTSLSPLAAKFQIRFGQGMTEPAIMDVVVDLPPCIHTTLRRIPKPCRRVPSWHHRPTEKETEMRLLENQFEEMTEDRALYFAFQGLEMYVAVEGVVSIVRCEPYWLLPDEDGRALFKERNSAWKKGSAGDLSAEVRVTMAQESMSEVAMVDRVHMGAFDLQTRARLLDTHPQPISQLFLDPWQGRLWVARENGYASIISTRDKSVVSRMPHPSTDTLLPPPSLQDCTKLPESDSMRVRRCAPRGVVSIGIESHKESRDLPPAHLTQIIPATVRRQRALLLFYSTLSDTREPPSDFVVVPNMTIPPLPPCQRTLSLTKPLANREAHASAIFKPQISSSGVSDAGVSNSGASSSHRLGGIAGLISIDGRSDMKSVAKARESREWMWMRQLQLCRTHSLNACQTQRRRYYALCEHVGRNVAHVIQELGHYASLCRLRAYFNLWKDHHTLFNHMPLMSRQRTVRLERERALAQQWEASRIAHICAVYFVKWQRICAGGKYRRQEEALSRFARAAITGPRRVQKNRRIVRLGLLPTMSMMEHFHRSSALRQHWRTWQAWASDRSRQQHFYKCPHTLQRCSLSLWRTHSLPSLAPSMVTPPRQLRSGRRGDADDFGAKGMSTPYHPINSACSYFSTAPLSLTLESANKAYAPGGGGAAASLQSSDMRGIANCLSTSPPPTLELLFTELIRARVYVFHFSDVRSSASSVLDESWSVIIENAELGADSDDDDDRRFSVFRFALLPLLQGLISTADDVLPNLFNESVAEEVMSMLTGITIAMDYVTANAAYTWWTLREAASLVEDSAAVKDIEAPRSAFDASLVVLRSYTMRAFKSDPESAEVLRGLAKSKKLLAQFLDFAMERAVARRVEHI